MIHPDDALDDHPAAGYGENHKSHTKIEDAEQGVLGAFPGYSWTARRRQPPRAPPPPRRAPGRCPTRLVVDRAITCGGSAPTSSSRVGAGSSRGVGFTLEVKRQ